jgi:acyl-CoA synthetase (AMP-forming)/AMP-acid ligase II
MQVLDRIYETALASPDKTALVYNQSPISYRDLHQRIAAMRRQIAALDLRAGGVAVAWIDNILSVGR